MESPGEGGGTPSTLWELESVMKFVRDGWNLVAELDGDDEIVRTSIHLARRRLAANPANNRSVVPGAGMTATNASVTPS